MRLGKPFICPAIIGPEERDLADFSLSHGQEGSTTPSTKSVFVGMGNYFFLPQIRSVLVTRITVNKDRLSPLFHCRVCGSTCSDIIAPHGVTLTGLLLPSHSKRTLLDNRMNQKSEKSELSQQMKLHRESHRQINTGHHTGKIISFIKSP